MMAQMHIGLTEQGEERTRDSLEWGSSRRHRRKILFLNSWLTETVSLGF